MDSSALYATIGAALVGAIIYYHFVKFSFWSSRGIKGPRPWPFFGTNVYYLFRHKLVVDAEWRQKYGRHFGIYEGYEPTLRICDNEVIKHIYVKEFSSFTDRNHKVIHGRSVRRWILFSRGDFWMNQRAMLTPMFTSSRMRLMFQQMSNCIDNFMNEADKRIGMDSAASSSEQEKTEKMADRTQFSKRDLMDMTLDVIAQSFYSLKINTYRDKTNEFLRHAYDVGRFNLTRFIAWLLLPVSVARYLEFDLVSLKRFRYFNELSMSIVKDRRRRADGGSAKVKHFDFIQAMMEARLPDNTNAKVFSQDDDREAHYNDRITHDELEKIHAQQVKASKHFRLFSDEDISGVMIFMFVAGFEATAATISSCIYELAHQPKAQEEVREELLAKLNLNHSDDARAAATRLDYSQLMDMKKLDAFVSEVLRLYSTLIENNRLVTAEGGAMLPLKPKPIWLPKDTVISTNFYIVHRDAEYFDRPNEFDMSRFYPENRDKIKSCTYLPFGVGPRTCAGMRFALLEIKLMVAKLLLRYSVRPGDTNRTYPPKYNQHTLFLQFKNTEFKLIPRHG